MMKSTCHYLQRSALLLAFTFLALLVITSSVIHAIHASEKTTVHFSPPSGYILMQDEIAIEVWVSNVNHLYGLDIRATFDPGQIQIIDADPSRDGVQILPRRDILSPDIIVRREADNDKGVIWYAVTQLNPAPPVSGSGAVFAFKMHPLNLGVNRFDFSNVQLVTRDGEVIQATAIPATYTIANTPFGSPSIFLPLMVRWSSHETGDHHR